MARSISGRSLQSTIYLYCQGSQRRGGQITIGQVRKEHSISSSHPSVQTDLWLFLQRIRIYPSPGLHTRFYLLEATWRASHTGEPRTSNSPARCFLHTGCLQCMARLVFVQGHGIHHEHDARGLPAAPGCSSSHYRCERNCPWRSLADQSGEQATSGCTLRRDLF